MQDFPISSTVDGGSGTFGRLAARWLTAMMIISSMAVVTARLIDDHPLRSANDRSRWCTVWSLVERGTYKIDEIRRRPGWDTIDLVRHEGHFYSTKPPILPRIVAELYRFIKWSLGWTLDEQLEWTTRLILFLINIVPMAIALALLARMFRHYCVSPFGQALLVTVACWGTMLLPFLTVFNNHTIAATGAVFSLAAAVSIVLDGHQQWWRFFLCGLFAAWTVCNELPAAAMGAGLFAVLVSVSPRKTFTAFLIGAAIPIVAFFVTNYQATGSWKPFYMYYGTEKYVFVHEGVPSYWAQPKGIDKNIDSTPTYLLHCTVGHHGLLSLSPILLWTVLGWVTPYGWREKRFRIFHAMGLGLTALVLGFYLTKTNNYNYGGVSVALRWMLWLTPFWLLSMIPFLNAWGHLAGVKVLSVPLLAVSIFSAWYPREAPWTQPWLFQLMSEWEWIDYSDPRPAMTGNPRTWLRSLPEGPLQEDYWAEWSSFGEAGQVVTVRLSDGGPAKREGVDCRIVEVVHSRAGEPTQRQQLLIDVSRHSRGAGPRDFLVWSEGTPEQVRELGEEFLAGVPGPARYRSSRIRYVKTPVRRDAFECLVAYTYVTKDVGSRKVQVVRDAWFTREVPYGLLQWEERIIDAGSGSQYSRQAWNLSRVGSLSSGP